MPKVTGSESRARLGAFLVGLALSAGCAAADVTTVVPSSSRQQVNTRIVHEPCPAEKAVTIDLNFDGRPDRLEIFNAKVLVCRAIDLNFDGDTDEWAYFDETGAVRRRETDFDRDGLVDEVSLYDAGVIRERRRATTVKGRFDTWHFYAEGRIRHALRDANGDGYVDQWWEYGADRKAECPLIHSDVDGDGRPDPGATIDLCRLAEGEDDELDDDTSAEPVRTRRGEIPTEVSSESVAPSSIEGDPKQ